jgi:NAD(P)-dependent dehydrogenase (short-subunit alcohol dehydrogenase family)
MVIEGAVLQKRMDGKTALVTGASRGIGAEVARLLAGRGADIAINFRSKGSRATEIADEVRARERRAMLAQADLTDAPSVERMMLAIGKEFGRLDILILNASGGLEKDKPASYAMDLNLTAQVQTLNAALPLMPAGGCIVFVTSHWAHFYGKKPVYAAYENIAASKKAGENALRERLPDLSARGLRLAIVSGDMIDGTITPKLLERSQPGLMAARRDEVGALPSIHEFAIAIVEAAASSTEPTGRVYFVGPTD